MSTLPSTQPAQFAVRASSANNQTRLTCTGKLIVSTAAQFTAECKRWTEVSGSILLDLGGLTYMDSAGLGSVVSAYTSAKKAGCDFQLLNITPRVTHLLQLTNLAKVLQPTTENLL